MFGGHTTVSAHWGHPAGDYPAPPADYAVYAYTGETCDTGTLVASYPRPAPAGTAAGGEFSGGGLARGQAYTLHVTASGPGGSHEKPDVYASAQFSTG